MAIYKQGQLCQWIVPMVDKTDFASIESGVTSGFTCALIGVKQNSSAATSTVTLSRAPSVITSGIFRVTAKTTETSGLDDALLKITHASCAMQLIPVSFQVQDLSGALSDIHSQVTGASNMLSGMSNILSNVFVDTTDISNVLSNLHADVADLSAVLSDFYSDFGSKVPKAPATASVMASVTSDIAVIKSRVPAVLATSDMLSDALSKLSDTLSKMGGPENIASLVWDADKGLYGDASSMGSVLQNAGTAALTASNISDIASAVWGAKYDVNSVASSFGSAFEVMLSGVSDLTSRITSVVTSTDSTVSAVWAHSAATVMKSRLSNVNSGVDKLTSRLTKAAATASGLTVVYNSLLSEVNGLSDILSNVRGYVVDTSAVLSDFYSDFQSRVPKAVATASRLLLAESVISDAHSAAAQGNSRALVLQSRLSDVESALDSQFAIGQGLNASTMSDLRSAITAVSAVITASDISDIASAVWATPIATKVVKLDDSDMSDIRSAIGDVSVTLTASDISDIASAAAAAVGAGVASQVWAYSNASQLGSNVSDILSAAQQTNSRALVLQSLVSDVGSALDSQYAAGQNLTTSALSDIRSAISAVALDASTISNIASAVWNQKWDVHSNASTFGSAFERLMSDASDTLSAAQQANSRALVLESMVSDVQSAADSQALLALSKLSDIQSAATQINSRALVLESLVSDIDSAMSSQFLVTSSSLSDIYSATSDISSDLAVISGVISDIHSDAAIAESRISDIYSLLQATTKGAERFVASTGEYTKYATDGTTVLWSHIVSSNATSVVRGAGA